MGPRVLVVGVMMGVLACAPFAGEACAASVRVVVLGPLDNQADAVQVLYAAAPGEANRLTATARTADPSSSQASWTFRDTGAPIEAGDGCFADPVGSVTCPLPPARPGHLWVVLNTQVTLGDGADTADLSGPYDVDAGAGDDTVAVHAGGASVALGDGADSAFADGGEMGADGGPGPDTFNASAAGAMEVSYDTSPAPVSVTLDGQANDGGIGEGDDVRAGVTGITGSHGPDVLDARGANGRVKLIGSDGDDVLYAPDGGGDLDGQAGRDVLYGGPGPDELHGGLDGDQLFGGDGNDGLGAGPGTALVDGGPGSDAYTIGDADVTVRARDATPDVLRCYRSPRTLHVDLVDGLVDCAPAILRAAPKPRIDRHRRLHLTVSCPRSAHERCVGTVRIGDGHRRALGFARVVIASDHRATLLVRLRRLPTEPLNARFRTHRTRPPASERVTELSLGAVPHA